jgi:hypothetical protein
MTKRKFLRVLNVLAIMLALTPACWGQTEIGDTASPLVEPEKPLFRVRQDDPTRDFDLARQSFLEVDLREAAARIRRGIAAMQEQSRTATAEGRQAIRDSVEELENLAEPIEQKREKSSERLDGALARAQFALAHHHYLLAIKAHNDQARKQLGQELHLAAEQLQNGVTLRVDLRKKEAEIQLATKKLAAKLIDRRNATPDEIGDGITSFGDNMPNLRERALPADQTAAAGTKAKRQ